MHLQESGEMYLETIYVLSKNGVVRSLDVAEYMGFSKPSVSRAVGLLKQGGYLLMDKEGYLTLTESGLDVAKKIYERHTLLSKFLVRLGVDERCWRDLEFRQRLHWKMPARWSTTSATNRFRR